MAHWLFERRCIYGTEYVADGAVNPLRHCNSVSVKYALSLQASVHADSQSYVCSPKFQRQKGANRGSLLFDFTFSSKSSEQILLFAYSFPAATVIFLENQKVWGCCACSPLLADRRGRLPEKGTFIYGKGYARKRRKWRDEKGCRVHCG